MRSFKYFLTLAGRRLPKHYARSLTATANYLLIGRWMSDHNYAVDRRVNQREEVWSKMAEQAQNRRVLYLEFGVYRGESMRYWSRVLKNPETKLHGFDSFEGLPEKGGPWKVHEFDTGGQIPVLDDVARPIF